MTTTEHLTDMCGHGLPAWTIDGHHYHERKSQNLALDGTTIKSGGLMVDACELPPGVVDVTPKARRR